MLGIKMYEYVSKVELKLTCKHCGQTEGLMWRAPFTSATDDDGEINLAILHDTVVCNSCVSSRKLSTNCLKEAQLNEDGRFVS